MSDDIPVPKECLDNSGISAPKNQPPPQAEPPQPEAPPPAPTQATNVDHTQHNRVDGGPSVEPHEPLGTYGSIKERRVAGEKKEAEKRKARTTKAKTTAKSRAK